MNLRSLGLVRKKGVSPSREEAVVEEAESLEGAGAAEDAGENGDDDEKDEQTLERAGGAGALHEAEDDVDHDPDDRELNQDLPRGIRGEPVEEALETVGQEHERGSGAMEACGRRAGGGSG
jgi:hypothetical protein